MKIKRYLASLTALILLLNMAFYPVGSFASGETYESGSEIETTDHGVLVPSGGSVGAQASLESEPGVNADSTSQPSGVREMKDESKSHTVMFYDHAGTMIGKPQSVPEDGSAIAPDVPAREGYTFVRWSKSFNRVTEDLEITPVYEKADESSEQTEVSNVEQSADTSEAGNASVPQEMGDDQDSSEPEGSDASVPQETGDDQDTLEPEENDSSVSQETGDDQNTLEPEESDASVSQETGDDQESPEPEGSDASVPQETGDDQDSLEPEGSDASVPQETGDDQDSLEPDESDDSILQETGDDQDSLGPEENDASVLQETGDDEGAPEQEESDEDVLDEVEKHTVTFRDYDSSVIGIPQSVPDGGAAVAPEDPERWGYTFIGWSEDFDFVTEDLDIYAQYSANTYTVRFLDWNDDELSKAEGIEHGTAASLYEPSDPPVRDGYTFARWEPPINDAVIIEDTEFVAVYRQNDAYTLIINYIYEYDMIIAHTPYVTMLNQGESYSVSSPSVLGHEPDQAVVSGTASADLAENGFITIDVYYTVSTGIPYTVEHWFQDVSDDGYTKNNDLTEQLTAMTSALVEVDAKTIPGFTAREISKTAQIASDGTTVVEFYYDRDYHTINFDTAGGTPVDPIVARFGTPISVPANPERTGYTFVAWDEVMPAAMPAVDMVITAQWTAEDVVFTVNYWLQNADDDDYKYHSMTMMKTKADSELLIVDGKFNDNAATTVRTIPYFTYERYDEGVKASGDGSTIFNVYFMRNVYVITFNLNDPNGKIEIGGSTYTGSSYTITARYEADIASRWPTEVSTTIANRKFSSWGLGIRNFVTKQFTLTEQIISTANGASAFTLVGQWSTNALVPYKIHYMLENIDSAGILYGGRYYTESDAHTQVSNNMPNRSWSAKEITGFNTPPGETGSAPHDASGSPLLWGEGNGSGFGFRANMSHDADGNGYLDVWFYYTRKSFNLDFFNSGAEDTSHNKTILYEAPIEGENWTPQRPASFNGRPTNADFTFDGWYMSRRYAEVNRFVWTGATMPGNHLSLYAHWITPSYTVTFDAKGGSPVSPQTVTMYEKISDAGTTPDRTGYVFRGWYKQDGSRFSFGQEIVGNLTLNARWTAVNNLSYEVRYQDTLGGEVASTKTVTGKTIGDTVTERAIAVSDYAPNRLSSSLTISDNLSENVIVFLYEPYAELSYTVRYLSTDGEVLLPEKGVVTLSNKAEERAPSIPGYVPRVYAKSQVLSTDASENIIEFLYRPNALATYTVEYYQQRVWGGYDKVDLYTLQAPKYSEVTGDARIYVGYELEPALSQTTGYVAENGTLVLRFYYKLSTTTGYGVEHWVQNITGDEYTQDGETLHLTGKTHARATAAKRIYDYASFDHAKPPLTTTGPTILEDGSLLIKLFYNRLTARVAYNGNGNTGGSTPSDHGTYRYGAQATVLSGTGLTRTGYTFDDWNTEADGTGVPYAEAALLQITGNVTLYAQWTINRYTVFYMNDDEVLQETPNVAYGSAIPDYTGETPTREGHGFSGWTGVPNTMPDHDVYIYARFIPVRPPIRFVEATGEEGTYDGSEYGLELTGTKAGDTILYSTDGGETWSDVSPTYTDAGEYPVLVKVKRPQREMWAKATIKVFPATLTVTAADKSKVYDESDPALTYTYEGAVGSEVPSFTGSLSREIGEDIGTYDIERGTLGLSDGVASGFKADNYLLIYVPAEFEITPATAEISVSGEEGTYDGSWYGLELTGTKSSDTVLYSKDNGSTWTATPPIYMDAGEYPLLVLVMRLNYHLWEGEATIKISPATLTVTAADKSKVYGESDPVLTYTYEGAVGSEVPSFTGSLSREPGESVGTYGIEQGTLTLADNGSFKSGNYVINYVAAEFEITPATAEIDVTGETGTYDGSEYGLEITGTEDGDTILYSTDGGDTWTTTPPTYTDAGIYPVLVKVERPSHELWEGDATIRVSPATLTVTAAGKSKVYGESDPALTYTYEGAVGSEEPLFTGSLSREPGENVGTYDIEQGTLGLSNDEISGFKSGNYVMEYVPAELTITPAMAEIYVWDENGTYDGSWYGLEITGTEDGDTILYSTDGGNTWTATPPTYTDAGIYPVLVKVERPNHELWQGEARIMIDPATLTVTAADKSKVYGESDPALMYGYEGEVGSEVPSFTGGLTREPGENVGTYDIEKGTLGLSNDEASGFKSGNYVMEYVLAEFEITPATAEIDVTGEEGTYDGNEYGLVISGTEDGDTILYSTDGGDAWTATPPTYTDAGSYPVLVKVERPNHELWEGEGTIVIDPATLTVTAADKSKVYGESDPALTYTHEGAVGDEMPSFTGGLTRESGEDVGTYDIEQGTLGLSNDEASGFKSDNYLLIYIPAELTITPTTAEISVTGETGTYNGSEYGLELTGTEDGDTIFYSTDGGDTWTTTPPAYTDAGEYPVMVKVERPGHELWEGEATIKVSPATLTVTAADKSKVYGESDPTLTYTYKGAVGSDTPSFTGSLSRVSGETAGKYAIVRGDLALRDNGAFKAGNYTLDFVEGILTIYVQVLYNDNGSTDGSVPVDARRYSKNETATVLGNTGNLIREGAVFLGWSTKQHKLITTQADEDAAEILLEGAFLAMGEASVTLYAGWAEDVNGPAGPGNPDGEPDYRQYTMTYDANGGTGAVPVDGDLYSKGGAVPVLFTPAPKMTGYSFAGWSTDPSAREPEFAPGGSTVLTMGDANTTLYAVYKINTYTLTVVHVDESGNVLRDNATIGVAYNAEYRYSVPKIAGYTAKMSVISGIMGAQDLTVRVVYVPNQYTLTIQYVFIGGRTAAPTYTATVSYMGAYSVDSPELDAYTPNRTTVSGVMPMHDLTVTVLYTRGSNPIWTTVTEDMQAPLNTSGVSMNVGDCFD